MNLFEVENAGVLFGFLVSLICSSLIVVTTKWHGKFTLDGTTGIQKQHAAPIPRVGGAAILAGLVVANRFLSEPVNHLFSLILVAALPAFCFGFIEDLTKRVSVRTRLLATMASGVMAWLLMDISITHTGLWGIDTALAWLPFSVLFTSFAVGGVANAVNIIDGFNGLASGTVAICVFALGMIAAQVGDPALATMCFVTCAAIAGFLVVNFPFGKLFLGDGGAYMLGFLLAWLAIMLPARNPSVSVWASFLVCGYPIFETMFTIARRVWTRTHPGLADSSHLHSLVKVGVSDQLFAGLRPQFANALVSPFCWAIAALAATLAVRHAGDTGALVLATVSSFLVYLGCYWGVTKAASQSVRKPARPPLTIVASNKIDKFAKSKTYVSGNPEPSVDDDDIVRARMG